MKLRENFPLSPFCTFPLKVLCVRTVQTAQPGRSSGVACAHLFLSSEVKIIFGLGSECARARWPVFGVGCYKKQVNLNLPLTASWTRPLIFLPRSPACQPGGHVARPPYLLVNAHR